MKIKTLSVSEVNNYIKKILDNDFILNNLSVKGELSNLKYHSSGHIYFSLKDNLSRVNCIMFKSKAYELEFALEEGMEVVITGRASVYSANGTFQLYCDKIVQEGLGELYIKFERLKEKLKGKGYFDIDYKKEIPMHPYNIGVVTSETGAAIQDIRNVIRRRNSLVNIILYPAQVQGDGAYKSVIKGIEYFNKENNVDVIIIGRGGGSIEELWNFNEEKLAMSIFNSKIPIISAVGHEIDFTISDFVADLRAATPSQAAEMVVPLEKDIYEEISVKVLQINSVMISKFAMERRNLENINRILNLNSPMSKIANAYSEIENVKQRMDTIISGRIKREKEKIISLNYLLQAHNPINILGKGYAIIEGENETLIKSKDSFEDTNNLKIILKDGYVKGTFILEEKGGDL